MVKINWTIQSVEDINSIAEFISRDSEKYAGLQVEMFFDYSQILESQPLAGRIVPELDKKNIRELIIGNYRLIYEIISANRIDILTVHHSARLIINSPVFRKKNKK
jgi:addiction module RelE/StbE family toxin